LGSFQSAMSRDIEISCGIQWLAQVARYFSQAHLYLNGTNWLTSVLALMMRLSATLTRRMEGASVEAANDVVDKEGDDTWLDAIGEVAGVDEDDNGADARTSIGGIGVLRALLVETFSSQESIIKFRASNYQSVGFKHQAILVIA
jgi:hypothetical protein